MKCRGAATSEVFSLLTALPPMTTSLGSTAADKSANILGQYCIWQVIRQPQGIQVNT